MPEALLDVKSDRPISFITRGVPYGLLPFGRPTTHYFPFSSLGRNVCAGMLKCLSRVRCPVVILFDPNKVGQSEFEVLHATFGVAGYHLRLAYGDRATVTHARYLTQCLPSEKSSSRRGRIQTARQERGQSCPRELDLKPGTRGHGCPRSNLESALADVRRL